MLADRPVRALAHPTVRKCCVGTFGGMGTAVVIPLIFVKATELNHGAFPYLIGALVTSAAIFLLSWGAARKTSAGSTTEGDAVSHAAEPRVVIKTRNQTGGTNIGGDLNITAPRPTADYQIAFANRPLETGGYHTRIVLSLGDGYAAQGLRVVAHGTSISGLDVVPLPPEHGAVQMIGTNMIAEFPNRATFTVGAPLAPVYLVDIRTETQEAVRIDVG